MRLLNVLVASMFVSLATGIAPAEAGRQTGQRAAKARTTAPAAKRNLAALVESGGAGLGRTRIAVAGTFHQLQTTRKVSGSLTFVPGKDGPSFRVKLKDDSGALAPFEARFIVRGTNASAAYGTSPAQRWFSFATAPTLGHAGWNQNATGMISLTPTDVSIDYKIADYGPNTAFTLKLQAD